MVMIKKIKHINASKPLYVNPLPVKLIPVYYDPIKGLATTILN